MGVSDKMFPAFRSLGRVVAEVFHENIYFRRNARISIEVLPLLGVVERTALHCLSEMYVFFIKTISFRVIRFVCFPSTFCFVLLCSFCRHEFPPWYVLCCIGISIEIYHNNVYAVLIELLYKLRTVLQPQNAETFAHQTTV